MKRTQPEKQRNYQRYNLLLAKNQGTRESNVEEKEVKWFSKPNMEYQPTSEEECVHLNFCFMAGEPTPSMTPK